MIDGGPSHTPRPTSRQVSYRNESVRYRPEEPQRMEPSTPVDPPKRAPGPQRSRSNDDGQAKSNGLAWVKWVVLILVIAAAGVIGWLFWSNERSIAETIASDKYQAVFLSNGQVYFGKLSNVNSDYMKLTDIYYLERQLTASATEEDDEEESSTVADNNFQLLKYSEVLYGSEDAMVLSKDDIIRYENLRPDGVVARAIANR